MDDFPSVRQTIAIGIQLAPLSIQSAMNRRRATGIKDKAPAKFCGGQSIRPIRVEILMEKPVGDIRGTRIIIVQQTRIRAMAAIHRYIPAIIKVVIGQKRAVARRAVHKSFLPAFLQDTPIVGNFFPRPRNPPNAELINP